MRAARVLALGWALAAAPALPHRGHDAITMVTIEAGRVAVSHRFDAQDVEAALPRIAPAVQPSLDDPAAIAAFEAYLADRFAIAIGGRPVRLAPVRTEVAPAEIRVDFAGEARGRAREVRVRSEILADIHPGQAHQVNVRARGAVRTAQLRGGGAATLAFD